MSHQCSQCKLYLDISDDSWSYRRRSKKMYPIKHGDKCHYAARPGWCFDCLVESDLIQRCYSCDSFVTDDDTPVEIRSISVCHGHVYLGKIKVKTIGYGQYACNRSITGKWYCAACTIESAFGKIVELSSPDIQYTDLHQFVALGYQFHTTRDKLYRTGKSAVQVDGKIYRLKGTPNYRSRRAKAKQKPKYKSRDILI